jgi:hypothetical protein
MTGKPLTRPVSSRPTGLLPAIDDHPLVGEGLRHILATESFTVRTTPDGATARTHLCEHAGGTSSGLPRSHSARFAWTGKVPGPPAAPVKYQHVLRPSKLAVGHPPPAGAPARWSTVWASLPIVVIPWECASALASLIPFSYGILDRQESER